MYTVEIDRPLPLGEGWNKKGHFDVLEGLYLTFAHPLALYSEYSYRMGYDLCTVEDWHEDVQECDYDKGIYLVETRGEKEVKRFVLRRIRHFEGIDDHELFLDGYRLACDRMGEIA